MIVSSKGRYALRIMVALALRPDGGYIPLKELAAQEELSLKYLESIMTTLSKGGLVDASHGKNGGYKLNRPPEEYTVGSILRLTEKDLTPVGCDTECSRAGGCRTRPMWTRLNRMVDGFFEGITLRDLMDGEEPEGSST